MKKHLITSFVLVLGLTSIAPPSFAMKRSLPGGHPSDSVYFTATTLISILGWFWAKHSNALEPEVMQNNVLQPTTFVSQFGTEFAVSADILGAFLALTPTLQDMYMDYGQDNVPIPLSYVSNPALTLLTQLASGVSDGHLLAYVRNLSTDEIDSLKNDATFLDSQALKDLISQAVENEFAGLPDIDDTQCMVLDYSVSLSGEHFDVFSHDLHALINLAPTIATMGDLEGSQMYPIDVNLSNQALYLLTQMASGTNQEALQAYIRNLNTSQLEKLKDDAHFLKSHKLLSLIARTTENPFTWLPAEVLPLILVKAGPQGRSACSEADKRLNGVIATVRKPVTQGGFGCTDTLPVTSIEVGEAPGQPVAHGQMLYVTHSCDGTISVIDTNTHQVVASIEVGDEPLPPFVHEQMLYVVCQYDHSGGEGLVFIVDTTTNEVVDTIEVGNIPQRPVLHGQTLYVANSYDNIVSAIDTTTKQVVAIEVAGKPEQPIVHGQLLYIVCLEDDNFDGNAVSVIDTATNQVVATIPVGNQPLTPVVHGHMLYVTNSCDTTISVIDTNTNQVVATIEVGERPLTPIVHGHMLYVVNQRDGTVSVIDTNTNQVVHTIKVGNRPAYPVALGQMLYVTNSAGCDENGTVSVIDTNTNQVVATIEVGKDPLPPVVHGQMLYLTNYQDGTISVIDTNTNQVVAIIEVGANSLQPVVHGQMLYVASEGEGTIDVIDIGGFLPGQH